jgi:twinkle protein
MTTCVEKLPHDCGSSNALQVFEKDGKYDGYCFACHTYVPSPYGDKAPAIKTKLKKTSEQIQEEINEIAALPAHDLPTRSLRKETLDYFGVTVSVSETDGRTPEARHFPFTRSGKPIGYRTKLIPIKKMWSVGDFKGPKDFFGWQQAIATGAKRLFVTEGEDDCLALLQALKDKNAGTQWASSFPAVVSLTSGSSGAKSDFTHHLQDIRRLFKEVVLVFDNDEPGKQAEREVLAIYPTAKTVSLPLKDANECVIQGKSMALANLCLFSTAVPKNTRLVVGSSVYEAGRAQAKYGLSYPWDGLTELTRGMRFGETYYAGSGVKMGKSTLRGALAAHLIKEHGQKVFMAAPEETNRKTYQLLVGQMQGRVFHDPKIPFDFDAYDEGAKAIGDSLYLLNLYQHLDWTNLRSDIMVAANEGCKAIFIDPITNLTNGVGSGEANTHLQEIAQDLASLALDLDLIVWIFCHLKAPESGEPHERGGKVQSYQFAGSRAMMRSCHMMLGLEGNKDPDLPEATRNKRRLVLLEDREFGASGVVPIFYNKDTGLYSEIKD